MNESSEQQQTQAVNDTSLKYWADSWQNNRIGFHRTVVSKLFQSHLIPKLLSADQQKCVVFPLCGKSLDIKAVLELGHRVIGIEGCQTGIEAFFTENQIPFEIENDDNNQCQIYKATDRPIIIYHTNFFAFNKSVPSVDYIWDRGGLVAVSPWDREKYRDCLLRMMTPDHTQLFLVAINYDDPEYSAPPHVVSNDDVKQLFGTDCSIQLEEIYDETEEFNSRQVRRHISHIEEHLYLIKRK